MSAGLRSEDQFQCSICLELLTDPVSTPCGHNFCKTCINQHWDSNVRYDCPLCKEQFSSRPQLRVNTFIKEMVDQFRRDHVETVVRGVPHLEEDVRETMKTMMYEAELKSVQQFEVPLTLDFNTVVHRFWVHGDIVCRGHVWEKLSKNPAKYYGFVSVLGNRTFSSGRFYFQVYVKGKTAWTLGVTRGCIKGKGKVTQSPKYGFWSVELRNGNEYFALTKPPVRLSLHPGPEKVGVFVDYQQGLVSFYDVDTAALIYSFTGCCFNVNIYPYFGPYPKYGGINWSPLIICPVNQSA